MVSRDDFFIAVYTNKVKAYCDLAFFKNLKKLGEGIETYVVDNSEGWGYFETLRKIIPPSAGIVKLEVSKEPRNSRFQRNVAESVNELRNIFLKTDKKYFFIIESDVIPPTDIVELFIFDINRLPQDWGILGATYYRGFHKPNLKGLNKTHHVLSGCTVYKRELIEKYPFRYDEKSLGPFPDAWICFDAGKDFSFYDDNDIKCEHLHAPNGTRMSSRL